MRYQAADGIHDESNSPSIQLVQVFNKIIADWWDPLRSVVGKLGSDSDLDTFNGVHDKQPQLTVERIPCPHFGE